MKYIILFLSVCWINTLHAQTSKKSALPGYHSKILSCLLAPQQKYDGHNLKTTATVITSHNRVIAQSTYDNSLVTLSDSINLRYPNHMGSTYDYNTMIYPYNYPYNTSPLFAYSGIFTTPQVDYDTFVHWTNNPFTLVYGLYEFAYASYDTGKDLVSYTHLFVDSATNQNATYLNTFNTDKSISTSYSFRLSAGVADSAFKQYFSYDGSGRLAEDSTYELHLGTWRLASRSLYTYSVSNDLVQIDNYSNTTDTSFTQPLIEQLKYINTYDASHRLLSVLEKYYFDSLTDYVKDTFAYTGTHTFHTSWKEYQYDPINMYWAPMSYMTKALNTAGQPDTINTMSFDSLANSWIPQMMQIATYDTAHNPDTLQEYDYNFTAFPSTPDYTTIYHYQVYHDTTVTSAGVPPLATGNIILFPNPASDLITLSMPGSQQAGLLAATVININGQPVIRQTALAKNNMQISVQGLTPGMYWIMVSDSNGRSLLRRSFIKE